MKKLFSISMLLVAVLVGCKDDDVKLSAEQYLTAPANGWVFQSIMYKDPDNGLDTEVDIFATDLFEGCEKDDAYVFTSDGKFTIATNTKCNDDDDAVSD